jgi:hypothetical protein
MEAIGPFDAHVRLPIHAPASDRPRPDEPSVEELAVELDREDIYLVVAVVSTPTEAATHSLLTADTSASRVAAVVG